MCWVAGVWEVGFKGAGNGSSWASLFFDKDSQVRLLG